MARAASLFTAKFTSLFVASEKRPSEHSTEERGSGCQNITMSWDLLSVNANYHVAHNYGRPFADRLTPATCCCHTSRLDPAPPARPCLNTLFQCLTKRHMHRDSWNVSQLCLVTSCSWRYYIIITSQASKNDDDTDILNNSNFFVLS